MDNLLSGLSSIFFDLEIVTKLNNENPVLVFAVSCSIVGAMAVVLDFIIYFLKGSSLLNLKHGKQSFLFLFAWAVGALIIGWVGQLANIFVVSVSASALVGFTWPIIFTKYIKEKAKLENEDEPEQPLVEES